MQEEVRIQNGGENDTKGKGNWETIKITTWTDKGSELK